MECVYFHTLGAILEFCFRADKPTAESLLHSSLEKADKNIFGAKNVLVNETTHEKLMRWVWFAQNSAYSTCPLRGFCEVMQRVLVSTLNSHQFNLLLCRLNPDSKNTHRLQKPPLTKNQQGHRKSIEVWKTTYFNSVTPNSMDYGYWALFFCLFILDRLNKDPR